MKYSEYLTCANKHLLGCESLLRSLENDSSSHPNDCVLLELYYLAGYILEGLTVYHAYKLFNWDWNPTPADWGHNEDIQRKYNPNFTYETNLDYYYKDSRQVHGNIFYFNYRDPDRTLAVQGHHFQDIVKYLLQTSGTTFEGVPYFGNGEIDRDIKTLIDNWCPKVRYQNTNVYGLTLDKIKNLIATCRLIFNHHQ